MEGTRSAKLMAVVVLLWSLSTPVVARAQSAAVSDMAAAVLASEGGEVYRTACAACHGRRGAGDGPAARSLEPRPRDFTTAVFKFRSTPSGALPTAEDLYRSISDGVPGTWMPAWRDLLSERERWALVAYLQTLAPEFQAYFGRDSAMWLPASPPAEASAGEGRFVYLALKCWDCHGRRGRGDGPSAGRQSDDWGRPAKPYDLTLGIYRNGRELADIFRTMRTGLDGTPMPAYELEAVLYPGGLPSDLAQYATAFESGELEIFSDYLAGEADQAALDLMPEAARRALANRRLWSLALYLESLSRPRTLWYRLFKEDPNATEPPRRDR